MINKSECSNGEEGGLSYIIVERVMSSVGLVEYSDGSQHSALVGLNNVSVDDHLVQHHVSSVNIEHYLSSTNLVKELPIQVLQQIGHFY